MISGIISWLNRNYESSANLENIEKSGNMKVGSPGKVREMCCCLRLWLTNLKAKQQFADVCAQAQNVQSQRQSLNCLFNV